MLPDWGCCNKGAGEGGEFIQCKICKKNFHYKCKQITPNNIETPDWKCELCTVPNLNDGTPIRDTPHAASSHITQRSKKRPALSISPEQCSQPPLSKEDIREVIKELFRSEMNEYIIEMKTSIKFTITEEIKSIQNDVQELKKSMDFINLNYEEILKNQSAINVTIKSLEDKNIYLQSSVNELKNQIYALEQQARSCNIEIQCVPESKTENLITIVKKLGEVIGNTIKDDHIQNCTRIAKKDPSTPRPRSIVVQLNSTLTRDGILASVMGFNKSRPNDKLNSSHLGVPGAAKPIFVAEHLSPSSKSLHAATRQKAKEKGYKFIWVRNGRIFVRKDIEAKHILIRSPESLDKL